jgi:hypothetical protein
MSGFSLRHGVVGLIALLGGCAAAPPADNANDNTVDNRVSFSAIVDAAQQVDFVDSPAVGSATLMLNAAQSELTYDISATGLTASVVGVHFHHGAAGQNGPIIADLSATVVSNEGGSARIMGVWRTIRPEDLELLLAEELYINIHTVNYRGGEARGQIIRIVPVEME